MYAEMEKERVKPMMEKEFLQMKMVYQWKKGKILIKVHVSCDNNLFVKEIGFVALVLRDVTKKKTHFSYLY